MPVEESPSVLAVWPDALCTPDALAFDGSSGVTGDPTLGVERS